MMLYCHINQTSQCNFKFDFFCFDVCFFLAICDPNVICKSFYSEIAWVISLTTLGAKFCVDIVGRYRNKTCYHCHHVLRLSPVKLSDWCRPEWQQGIKCIPPSKQSQVLTNGGFAASVGSILEDRTLIKLERFFCRATVILLRNHILHIKF